MWDNWYPEFKKTGLRLGQLSSSKSGLEASVLRLKLYIYKISVSQRFVIKSVMISLLRIPANNLYKIYIIFESDYLNLNCLKFVKRILKLKVVYDFNWHKCFLKFSE